MIEGGTDHSYSALTLGYAGAANGESEGLLISAYNKGYYTVSEDFDETVFLVDGFADGVETQELSQATAGLLVGDDLLALSRTSIGDQNQDGYAEIALSLKLDNHQGVCLLYGPVTGSQSISEVDVVLSEEKDRSSAYSSFFGMDAAGDVDGNGVIDLIVGNSESSSNSDYPSEAYLFYGPVTTSTQLTSADVLMQATDELWGFAEEVSGLGDVNSDGYDDVFVHCNDADGPSHCIFLGPLDATDEYGTAEAQLAFELPTTWYGWANRRVSGAGDIDDDGIGDVLIGTAGRTVVCQGGVESESAGGAYVLFGPASGTIGEQDIDLFVSSGSCELVGYEAAGVGDVNSDGFDDFLLGAPNIWLDDDEYYYLGYGAGGAYLFLGPLGPGTVGTSEADLFFAGEAEGDVAGYSVAAAGDLDSDGISDFVIGAPMLDDPVGKSGAAYVILGGEDLLERYTADN